MTRSTLTERIEIRCSPEGRGRWEEAARRDRRSLSDWIRISLDQAAELSRAAEPRRSPRGRRRGA